MYEVHAKGKFPCVAGFKIFFRGTFILSGNFTTYLLVKLSFLTFVYIEFSAVRIGIFLETSLSSYTTVKVSFVVRFLCAKDKIPTDIHRKVAFCVWNGYDVCANGMQLVLSLFRGLTERCR